MGPPSPYPSFVEKRPSAVCEIIPRLNWRAASACNDDVRRGGTGRAERTVVRAAGRVADNAQVIVLHEAVPRERREVREVDVAALVVGGIGVTQVADVVARGEAVTLGDVADR